MRSYTVMMMEFFTDATKKEHILKVFKINFYLETGLKCFISWPLIAGCAKVVKRFEVSDESHNLYICNKKLTTTTTKSLKFTLLYNLFIFLISGGFIPEIH